MSSDGNKYRGKEKGKITIKMSEGVTGNQVTIYQNKINFIIYILLYMYKYIVLINFSHLS